MRRNALCALTFITSLTISPVPAEVVPGAGNQAWTLQGVGRSGLVVRDVLDVREFENVHISPDGRRVAYTVRRSRLESDDYQRTSYVLEHAAGHRPTAFADGVIANVRWRPKSSTLTYLDTDRTTIRTTSTMTGVNEELRPLADGEKIDAFEWSVDGQMLAVVSRGHSSGGRLPYVLRPDHYCADRCRPSGSGGGTLLVARANGRHVCRVELDEAEEPYGVTWAPNASALSVLTRVSDARRGQLVSSALIFRVREGVCTMTQRLREAAQIEFASSGDSVYVVAVPTNVDDKETFVFNADRNAIERIELGQDGQVRRTAVAKVSPARLGDPPAQIRRLAVTQAGVFAESGSRTLSSILKLDLDRPNAAPQALTKNVHLSQCSISPTGLLAACVRQFLETAPEVAIIELGTGKVTDLTRENAWLHEKRLGRVREIEVNDGLGRSVTMFVVYPIDFDPSRRYPAVILLYGFDGSFVWQAQHITSYAPQVYAARGIVTLLWNYPAFLRARIGDGPAQALAFQGNQAAAILEARRWLVDNGLADPGRVGIAGHSMGSTWADYVLAHHAGKFLAAASTCPSAYSGLRSYWEAASWFRTRIRHIYGGSPYEESSQWGRLAPARLTAGAVPQLREINEPAISTELEFRERGEKGLPVELWVYPEEEHIFSRPHARLRSLELNLDWFKFWLSDSEDPAPHKVQQYERWRQYRASGRPSPEN